MELLEFATEKGKEKKKLRGILARIVRVWLKRRADHVERRLNRRQFPVPEDNGEIWNRVREEISQKKR